MSTTPLPHVTSAASPQKHQRGKKWLCVGLGCLLIAGIVYSQPLGRETGVHVLGWFGARAVPWLLSALQDSDGNVQKVARESIQKMGPAAVPHLLGGLEDTRPATRMNAASMIGLSEIHTGHETEVSAGLLKLLGDKNKPVRLAVMQAQASLGGYASAALPKLKTILDDNDAEIRVGALQAVIAIDRDSPDTLSMVLKMLKDSDAKVRKDACSMLETIGTQDPRAVAALIEVLSDPAPEVRAGAADYLGEIGPVGKAAIPALQVVAEHDPNPDVRSQAVQSIKSLKELPNP